jgi:uncharacterized protein
MSAKPCPICRKPSVAAHHPFCSKRCSNLDLGRWLGGHYAIPAEEPPDADIAPSADEDDRPPRLH